MPHKADQSFFSRKRSWSKRKDTILAYYMTAYLAKIRRLGRPVLLIDGFAGAGKFEDGELGSPLLICAKVMSALQVPGPPIRVRCIEADGTLFQRLSLNLSAFPFAEAHQSRFSEQVDYITQAARYHSIFLYLDPFVASDIRWASLIQFSQQIRAVGASVELLINFNTPSFVRWALAATAQQVPSIDVESEDSDDTEYAGESPGGDRLTEVVGGNWWRDSVRSGKPFAEIVKDVAHRIASELRSLFEEVCWLGIKARSNHSVPKYHMLFGSRHPDALELMNDAMIKAQGDSDFRIDLFSHLNLRELILELSPMWIPRRQLMLDVIRREPARFSWKEIRGEIESLLRANALVSETQRTRVNDDTRVRRSSSPTLEF